MRRGTLTVVGTGIRAGLQLTVEARDAIMFDLPAEERLAAAMELLGLDYARLQDAAGHA